MPKKYAICITHDNLDLIRVLYGGRHVDVKQGKTYFLFTVDSPTTTTDHDIVENVDLKMYDGDDNTPRIILH